MDDVAKRYPLQNQNRRFVGFEPLNDLTKREAIPP